MDTGKNLCRDQNGAAKILQYLGPKEKGDFGQLYAYNPKLEGTQKLETKDSDNYLNIDYEMHFGTKIDYLFFQSSRSLQPTEIQLLQNQFEQERTQILTNLMLPLENPRVAGYMLTGYRSMFLETDGSVAWLHPCPKIHSPLQTMSQCYFKIPILYKGQIQFLDPLTQQTDPHATTQNCSDRTKNLFQLDMDQEDSWYILTPGTVHQEKPAIFGPQDFNPVASHTFTGSQDAGMYTRNEFKGFWETIPINAASRTALKKCSQTLIVYTTAQEGTDGSPYYTPRTEFFVHKVILHGYFKDQFLDIFVPVVYVLEHCAIYFLVFLFIKRIIDVVVLIERYKEIDKITGSTLRFGKTLLSASYKIFLTSVLTSMYNPRAPALTAVDHLEVGPCVKNVMHVVKEDAKKKEEHLYPPMSTVKPALSPV